MTELKDIELDLLLRIDFLSLTSSGENGYSADNKSEEDKENLKNTFGFSHYFKREFQGHEYVRLSDFEKETQPYIEYLKSLDKKGHFDCCQLEQAIGVFQNGDLKAFLSTDTGLCYDSPAHFDSVAKIFRKGESDLSDINTFYGKVEGEFIELLYSPLSNNIDISITEDITAISISKSDFELEFKRLIKRVNQFFSGLKMKSEIVRIEKIDFVNEVFKEVKKKA